MACAMDAAWGSGEHRRGASSTSPGTLWRPWTLPWTGRPPRRRFCPPRRMPWTAAARPRPCLGPACPCSGVRSPDRHELCCTEGPVDPGVKAQGLCSVCCDAAVTACNLERACVSDAERGRVSDCCILLHRSTDRLNQAAAHAVYRSRTADQTSARPTSDVPAYADSILDTLQNLQASLLGSSTLTIFIVRWASACLPSQCLIKLTPVTLYDLTGSNIHAAPTAAQWGRRGGE